VRHFGQTQVRVDSSISVTGEMLDRGQHAGGANAAQGGQAKVANILDRLAEGAYTDHWIGRIIVDVEHRREIDIDAERQQFFVDHAGQRFAIIKRTRLAQRHRRRQWRDTGFNARDHAAFLVDRDHQWHRRNRSG